MDRIITHSLGEDSIEKLSEFIVANFSKANNDFSRVACVFGGKRPSLFLRRSLSGRIKKPFYPPEVFSIDEFIENMVSNDSPVSRIGGLDSSYLIYRLAESISPQILKGRSAFSQFLPWAEEIVSFIEQLDLEAIDEKSLEFIQKSASIGYDVPENINTLLTHIVKLRRAYHRTLKEKGKFSRGSLYLNAAELVSKRDFKEFDAIIFCGFFYLHSTEMRIMKSIYDSGKGICIFQGNEKEWSVLKGTAKKLGVSLLPNEINEAEPKINFRAGFDLHSQISFVRETIKEIKEHDKTVIVLPQSQTLSPLLYEISPFVKDFNVSMGYPLKRSSFYALIKSVFKANESKKGDLYYTKDYLEVLRHPLVKNLCLSEEASITRILVHKIEEVLIGKIKTDLGGSLFVSLDSIENLNDIYYLTHEVLGNMNIKIGIDKLAGIVKRLHEIFFHTWDAVTNFSEFCRSLGQIVEVIISKSTATSFAFNLKVIDKIFSVKEELEAVSFVKESFTLDEMCEIFLTKLEEEMISFVGSPLRGLQILGLFETRSLKFKNVILMDVNESILPKLKIYEPLIPREIMLNLGLNRLEKEEEIQRYQFMNIIQGAENVYIIYEENQVKEKSRFIEELLWLKQKKLNKFEIEEIPKAVFNLKLNRKEPVVIKTDEMVELLKMDRYSASRLNVYLECPLQFYYKYVLGLSEAEDLLDEPQAQDVGDFIHNLLEETFKIFLNKKPVIDKEFKDYFWKIFEEKFSSSIQKRMKSDSLLLKGIAKTRLKNFLEAESKSQIEKILFVEEEFKGELNFPGMSFNFLMKVDRIDELSGGGLTIIDYKTGKIDRIPKKLQHLESMEFDRESIRENIKSFQLPLYYYFVQKQFPGKKINAELYSIRTLERKPFIAEADYEHRERVLEICFSALELIFREILNPDIPFSADKEENKCQFCDFSRMCR